MVAKVERESIVILVALEAHQAGEFLPGKLIFEWGEAMEVYGDGHVCG